MNYVGLAGIEVFDVDGKPVKIPEGNITACPPDINILPGYGGDPRTVDKLVNGQYFTNDDLNVWLAPFTPGEDHLITLSFPQLTTVSMIRIWNYNKSRIHSYRGVRLLSCSLDERLVFRGEVAKAPGNVRDPEQCCEVLLFTESEDIMHKIDKHDWVNALSVQNTAEDTAQVRAVEEERPLTATKKFDDLFKQQKAPTSLFDERPQTAAIIKEVPQ